MRLKHPCQLPTTDPIDSSEQPAATMPQVSIIVPAYNADRFLDATLDSVMASTWRDFEVVVAEVNESEVMRETLIARFGLRSPQGSTVDTTELARRQGRSRRDFADMHIARGNLFLGLKGCAELMARAPNRSQALACLARSSARRAVGS
jgi:cellulose synthase/poly-beta-1,6-N-acetylglucosamine synthase-like glycosyltransferase